MSIFLQGHIDELIRSFGRATPPINPKILKGLYKKKNYAAMLGWIKNSMRLDLRVGLRVVDQPENSHPMWIEIPRPMPPYGTPAFLNTRVVVNVQRDILENKPFSWIVAGFAHELSHVVLFSVGHRLQHDEKAVDLTAMILGYRNFVSEAEVTETTGALLSALFAIFLAPLGVMFWSGTSSDTSRLGYLTSEEAKSARKYLEKART